MGDVAFDFVEEFHDLEQVERTGESSSDTEFLLQMVCSI